MFSVSLGKNVQFLMRFLKVTVRNETDKNNEGNVVKKQGPKTQKHTRSREERREAPFFAVVPLLLLPLPFRALSCSLPACLESSPKFPFPPILRVKFRVNSLISESRKEQTSPK